MAPRDLAVNGVPDDRGKDWSEFPGSGEPDSLRAWFIAFRRSITLDLLTVAISDCDSGLVHKIKMPGDVSLKIKERHASNKVHRIALGREVWQFACVFHDRRNRQPKRPFQLVGLWNRHGGNFCCREIEEGRSIGQRKQCLACMLPRKVRQPALEPGRACTLGKFEVEKLAGSFSVRRAMQLRQQQLQLLNGYSPLHRCRSFRKRQRTESYDQ